MSLSHNAPSKKLFQVLSLLLMLLFSMMLCCCCASRQQHILQLKYKVVCLPLRSKNDYCCVYHRCASVFMNLYQLLSLSARPKKAAALAVTAFMTSQLKVLECPPHCSYWSLVMLASLMTCTACLVPTPLRHAFSTFWEAFGWRARNFYTCQCYGLRKVYFSDFL